ncbi:hypothetical protein A0H76_2826 [Hepatospora eriocheir]|uniref:Uncharacterized protein n=1 Tax=Hepatospora eriocheir TaxID=1081669 RepID=A0A1X0QL92_9MICR|nr:hypothetical protein A0H76_2826 [Hepatospora eriocheir]
MQKGKITQTEYFKKSHISLDKKVFNLIDLFLIQSIVMFLKNNNNSLSTKNDVLIINKHIEFFNSVLMIIDMYKTTLEIIELYRYKLYKQKDFETIKSYHKQLIDNFKNLILRDVYYLEIYIIKEPFINLINISSASITELNQFEFIKNTILKI